MQSEVSVKNPAKSPSLIEKRLLAISLIIATYFLTVFLLNYFQVDLILIGVFIELLTIPMMLGQLVFLIIGLIILIRGKNSRLRHLTIISVLVLAISSLLTIWSFF